MPRGAEAKKARKEKKLAAKADGGDVKSKNDEEMSAYFGEDPMAAAAGKGKDYGVGDLPSVGAGAGGDFYDPVAQLESMQAHQRKFESRKSCCDDSDEEGSSGEGHGNEETPEEKIAKGQKRRKKERKEQRMAEERATKGYFGEIKTLPLVFLILLTASGTLPVILWVADNSPRLLKSVGASSKLGYRLGLGEIPRKRVTSFYEKHSPEKLNEVENILSKYYGDYKVLTKKLERKYQDYGYFQGWENDDAASVGASIANGLVNLRSNSYAAFRKNAPSALVQASDNFYYNVGGLVKPAMKYWKKSVWPVLKPLIAIPDAKEAKKQMEADKKKYGKKKRRKKSGDFRDEED